MLEAMGQMDWFGKQAELMRELYRKHNGDRDRCVEEFAAAGERGEIVRKSNVAKQTWLYYASFKYREFVRRGFMDKDIKWRRNDPRGSARLFQVRARVTLVDNGYMDVSFPVQGADEDDVRTRVTPTYVMRNVSDDWGKPIRSVSVLRLQAVAPRAQKVMKA